MRNRRLAYFVHSVEALSEWSGRLVAFLLLGMAAVVLIEVVARYFFQRPTIWGHESAQLLFAAYAIIPGAYTLRHNAHVNMDLIYSRQSARVRAILDLCTSVFFFFWCTIFLWVGADYAAESIARWEHSVTVWAPPIWEVKIAIPLAGFLIILQGIAKFIRDLSIATTGKGLE